MLFGYILGGLFCVFILLFAYSIIKLSGDISKQEDVLIKETEDEKNSL